MSRWRVSFSETLTTEVEGELYFEVVRKAREKLGLTEGPHMIRSVQRLKDSPV